MTLSRYWRGSTPPHRHIEDGLTSQGCLLANASKSSVQYNGLEQCGHLTAYLILLQQEQDDGMEDLPEDMELDGAEGGEDPNADGKEDADPSETDPSPADQEGNLPETAPLNEEPLQPEDLVSA